MGKQSEEVNGIHLP